MSLLRRVSAIASDLVQAAVVRLVDDTGKVQKIQIESDGEDDLLEAESLLPYGFSAVAPAGSDAMVAEVSGDAGQAVVVAAQHRDYRPTGLKSGEVVLHVLDTVLVFLDETKKLYLGDKAATEPAVLGQAFKTYSDAHTHASPFGPTGAPITPIPSSALSSIVKVK